MSFSSNTAHQDLNRGVLNSQSLTEAWVAWVVFPAGRSLLPRVTLLFNRLRRPTAARVKHRGSRTRQVRPTRVHRVVRSVSFGAE